MSNYRFGRTVDGIVLKYDSCEHCGKLPTDQDIQDQMKIIRKEFGDPCAVCGKRARAKEAILIHHKQGGVDRWGGEVVVWEPVGELKGYIGGHYVEIPIHLNCAQTAFPYMPIGEPYSFCGQCAVAFKKGDRKTFQFSSEVALCDACVQKNHDSTYTRQA